MYKGLLPKVLRLGPGIYSVIFFIDFIAKGLHQFHGVAEGGYDDVVVWWKVDVL